MIYRSLEELQDAAREAPVVIDRWALLDLCGVVGAAPDSRGPKYLNTLFDNQANAALGIVVARALNPLGLRTRLGSRIFVRVTLEK